MSSHNTESERSESVQLNRQLTTASHHALNSYVEANNALLTAMGFRDPTVECSLEDDTAVGETAPIAELAFGDEEWSMVRSTDEYDDLGVGDYVHFSKPITEEDVTGFARITGDTNRLHLEESFAEQTRFGGRIVHGTLVAGTISAALARFPGLTVYLSQDLEFRGPVEIGETITAECEIVEELGSDQYRLETIVVDESDEIVIDGEAVVLIDELPDVDGQLSER